jgi:hypothetical protein
MGTVAAAFILVAIVMLICSVLSTIKSRLKMILKKLQEALAEVGEQRAALDDVEAQLRSMISKLSGVPQSVPTVARQIMSAPGPERARDRVDDIVDILRAAGKPLHITEIAGRLTSADGTPVDRTIIEPSLNRHVGTVKRKRIDKFGPSTFGLPEWKENTQIVEAS